MGCGGVGGGGGGAPAGQGRGRRDVSDCVGPKEMTSVAMTSVHAPCLGCFFYFFCFLPPLFLIVSFLSPPLPAIWLYFETFDALRPCRSSRGRRAALARCPGGCFSKK